MSSDTDSSKYIKELKERGITVEQFNTSLENFKKGFPFLKIADAAVAEPNKTFPKNGGIKVLSEVQQSEAIKAAESINGTVCKFVPASGAASRMFKDAFEAEGEIDKSGVSSGAYGGKMSAKAEETIGKIKKGAADFPFFDKCYTGKALDFKLDAGGKRQQLLHFMLDEKALNLGQKPKGLIPFHRYEWTDGKVYVRTPFEEHLVEGALYAKDSKGVVRIIYTVSPQHLEEFKALFESVRAKYEKRYGCKYMLEFTLQSPATDIVAVDAQNRPFVKEDGKLLFRPGGHGALLMNLDKINADYIFVKNIDNVVKETFIAETVKWKKILLGRAAILHTRCSHIILNLVDSLTVLGKFLKLASANPDDKKVEQKKKEARGEFEKAIGEAVDFLRDEFCVILPAYDSEPAMVQELLNKLNRPLRVCGMVKNEGEPGGGPFIVLDSDGSTSLQILEGAQIDKSNSEAVAALKRSTHFNPVDIVCSVKNLAGNKYHLEKFTDPASGLISQKSYKGVDIKAQELPGLWNGAMSNWNTQFIETPLITFNPVKTIFDLLRKEHQ